MELASLINARVDEEERIDGEDEEATGENNGQRQSEKIAQKVSEEAGEKTDRSQVESGRQEKLRRRASAVQTAGREKGRTG
jgi:hypothetical protein